MAKPKKSAPKPTASSNSKTKAVKHEILGVIFLFFGAFTLISLLSYQYNDPSLFTKTNKIAHNYGGIVGANLAEMLVQFSGISSFMFSILCFSFAARLFKGSSLVEMLGNVFWIWLAILSCATLMSLQLWPITFGGIKIPAGGVLGGFLATSLKSALNVWGATLFSLSVLLISLVFCTPFSASVLYQYTIALLLAAIHVLILSFKKAFSMIREFSLLQNYLTKLRIEKSVDQKILQQKPLKAKEDRVIDLDNAIEIEEKDDEKISRQPVLEASIVSERLQKVFEKKPAKPKKAAAPAPQVVNGNYTLPSLDFLCEPTVIQNAVDKAKLQENSRMLADKLHTFGIDGSVVAVRPGPVITMYEFRPAAGVKVAKIANLANDLSLALSAQSVRIIAPVPGRDVVGIEIPNEDRESVFLREILATDEFQNTQDGIPLAIGKDIGGEPVVADLAKMPHLLIAGAPGAGKSVFVNSLICSLLYKFTPKEMRLIMVDPKQLELNLYDNIPHLLLPVVDDPKKASTALKWAVNEMEKRYKIMKTVGVRHISGFNQKFDKEGAKKMRDILCPKDESGMPGEGSLSHMFQHDEKGEPQVERIPFILVIIDEFADLMMVAKNDVETSVLRIAQKARAAGIHLVIATQRPSVDVVTGLIKSNLPSRISFKVPARADSRTILDSGGAEALIGQGDMLFIPPGFSKLVRMHGAFVTEDEIQKICDHWRSQGAPVYQEEILLDESEQENGMPDGAGDDIYQEAISFIRDTGHASASMLQRRFKVGYNRASRIIEAMEVQGIVGPADGAKPREVLY